jgi:hypothetical protein
VIQRASKKEYNKYDFKHYYFFVSTARWKSIIFRNFPLSFVQKNERNECVWAPKDIKMGIVLCIHMQRRMKMVKFHHKCGGLDVGGKMENACERWRWWFGEWYKISLYIMNLSDSLQLSVTLSLSWIKLQAIFNEKSLIRHKHEWGGGWEESCSCWRSLSFEDLQMWRRVVAWDRGVKWVDC